jgi:glycosyltransferase involved in cell wall biosynthesis
VRRRLLVIAHPFPPAGGGGVQRTLGFVRHLPEHGWDPVVVAGPADDYWASDLTLAEDLAAPVLRVRPLRLDATRSLGRRALPRALRRRFDRSFVPDTRVAWGPPALAAALRLHEEAPFDAVYATGPPWTDHLVAARFATKTGVPYVADFRDPWTFNPLEPPPASLVPVHRQLEAWVHARAALSIASTETYRRRMQTAFRLPPDATMHLPNGYTDADFDGLPGTLAEGALTLGYAGSFYGAHSPRALFEQLDRVAQIAPDLDLRVELYGNTGGPRARRFPIREHGYVDQRSALEGLARCRVVFLTVPDRAGADGCVPQKLYVYLRLGRPILWCGPEGDATAILRRAGGASFALDPARPDASGLARWLAARVDEDRPPPFDREVVAEYDRRVLTRRLADRLSMLSDQGDPRRRSASL